MAILKRLFFSGSLLLGGLFVSLAIISQKTDWLSQGWFGNVNSVTEALTSVTSPVKQVYYKWQDEKGVWHYSEKPNILASNKTVVVNLDVNVLPSEEALGNPKAEPEGRLEKLGQLIKKADFLQRSTGIAEAEVDADEKLMK
jgi:hypothetical protein